MHCTTATVPIFLLRRNVSCYEETYFNAYLIQRRLNREPAHRPLLSGHFFYNIKTAGTIQSYILGKIQLSKLSIGGRAKFLSAIATPKSDKNTVRMGFALIVMSDILARGRYTGAGAARRERLLGSNALFSSIAVPWARDYLALLKPRVMSLVVFTGFTGLILAPAGFTFQVQL